jgi:hypothetical protein
MEETMARKTAAFLVVMTALAMTACSNSASDVDYSRDRAIGTDIDASLDHGPTAAQPGAEERIGTAPHEADEGNDPYR